MSARTALWDLPGIEYPIGQSGMGSVAGPDLAGRHATTVTDAFTGLWARALRNRMTEEYAGSGAPVLPPLWQAGAARDITAAAIGQGNGDYMPMWSGQGVGLIHNLPGAGEVVETIVLEAGAALEAMRGRIR